MYFGLICLFLGAIAMVATRVKVGRLLATGTEVYWSINLSIWIFESNMLGLVGGMFLKHVIVPTKALGIAFLMVMLTIVALAFGIVFVYNVNETIFKTYKYFLTEVTKRFYGTIIVSTIFWVTVYCLF